jgi:hypothetical protein
MRDKVVTCALLVSAFFAVGCAYAKPTCKVIDLADTACEVFVVQYETPDGITVTERVSRDQLRATAMRARAVRLQRTSQGCR